MSETSQASASVSLSPSRVSPKKKLSFHVVPVSEQDILLVQQKVALTIDELVTNNEYKVRNV